MEQEKISEKNSEIWIRSFSLVNNIIQFNFFIW